ncbi:hypothetical protein MBT42_18455 [Streptomyces sp. MBT42]|uniref:hypothetical protein n=1 Tax=Streptomyces sp. MBT42 TaxID=1488373 RepID=UPI001E29F790|nr:hypothetical protein [Streptomyces sp. MBT42]MCD2465539.1 hypothetical protein [Streptomyces sp. MBT42]
MGERRASTSAALMPIRPALVAEADLLERDVAPDEEGPEAGVVEVRGGRAVLECVVQLADVDPGAVADEGWTPRRNRRSSSSSVGGTGGTGRPARQAATA